MTRFIVVILVIGMWLSNAQQDDKLLAGPPIKICSFNLCVFGLKKMKNALVRSSLIEIISKYDITTVQEIRDSSETAFPHLIELLNENGKKFDYVISERLGSTKSKEQYAVIYRTDHVQVLGTYQYDDRADDVTDQFERAPFAVLFRADNAGKCFLYQIRVYNSNELRPNSQNSESFLLAAVSEFSVISVHTKPAAAVSEINKLTKVYEVVSKHWKNPNSIIAGDYNADCDFVTGSGWRNISLWQQQDRFQWMVGRCHDTTVKDTDCSYDRFVVAGKSLQAAIRPGSARVVRFDQDQNLTIQQALQVSDHYPIEMQIVGKAVRGAQKNLETYVSFVVAESKFARPDGLRRLAESAPSAAGFGIITTSANDEPYEVVAHADRIHDLGKTFDLFRNAYADVVSVNLGRSLRSFAALDSFVEPKYIYGLNQKVYATYEMEIRCHFKDRYCAVSAYHKNS